MYSILHGREKSNLSLFLDNSCNNFLPLAIINEAGKRSGNVVVFCYQRSPQWYKEHLPEGNRLKFFDGYNDPLNWESLKDVNSSSCKNPEAQIRNDVIAAGGSFSSEGFLMIDDILLFGRSHGLIDARGDWNNLVQIIVNISQEIPTCIFLNPNLLNDADVGSLIYQSSFYCKFNIENDMSRRHYKCQSILKKQSGKVSAEVCSIQLDIDGTMTLTRKNNDAAQIKQEDEDVDPTSNLTFNLRLTENEREARANTTLPYILKDASKSALLRQSNQSGTPSKGGVVGEVIYTPDDLDDFDDEDPDDDLDI